MLLLIACSNVANLLLSRATVRDREMAIRASLGASRARLFRQLLVESFALAVAGCVVGCLFAYVGLKVVESMIPPTTLPYEVVITLRPEALGFAVSTTVLSTLLCGLAPLIRATRSNLYSRAASSGKGVGGDVPGGKLRGGLVVGEVAVSIVLLAGTGLMARTIFALQHVDLGFNPAKVLFLRFHQSKSYDSPAQKNAFARRVLDKLETIPGVRSAAESIATPPYSTSLTDVSVLGKASAGSL